MFTRVNNVIYSCSLTEGSVDSSTNYFILSGSDFYLSIGYSNNHLYTLAFFRFYLIILRLPSTGRFLSVRKH